MNQKMKVLFHFLMGHFPSSPPVYWMESDTKEDDTIDEAGKNDKATENTNYLPAAGRQIPKITYRRAAYSLPHFCSPLCKEWTFLIQGDISPTFVHSLKSRH